MSLKNQAEQKNKFLKEINWSATSRIRLSHMWPHKAWIYSEDWQIIWAMSWENLFMPYANNKGADQPAHPHSLISACVIHCPDNIILLLAIVEISRL